MFHASLRLSIVLLIASMPLLRAADDVSLRNHMDAALHDYQEGKFDAALAAVEAAEKRGEPNASAFDLKGRIYIEQGKHDEAVLAFDAAYKLAPASLARLHCGDMFLREKHWDEACALYEAATKETNILVTNERLRYGILLSFLGAKNDEAARAALDKMTFPTESPAYYYAQAAWSFAHDANSDGEKWMRRAEAVFPVKSTAWFVRPLFDLGWVKTKPPLIAD